MVIETLQFVFRLGIFEMHDILWNSLGGIIGVVIFTPLSNVYRGLKRK